MALYISYVEREVLSTNWNTTTTSPFETMYYHPLHCLTLRRHASFLSTKKQKKKKLSMKFQVFRRQFKRSTQNGSMQKNGEVVFQTN